MARKDDLRAQLEELTGESVAKRTTVEELESRLRAAIADQQTAGDADVANTAAGGDESAVRVTRGAGMATVRVKDGATLVHGDPDAGEDRRAYEGGEELEMPTAQAVELTLAGAVVMTDTREA